MDPIDLDALAAALEIELRPEWHPIIRTNLDISLRMAREVASFELDDEVDLSPVFRA